MILFNKQVEHSLEETGHLVNLPTILSVKGNPVADTAINPLVVSKGKMGVRDTVKNIWEGIITPTIPETNTLASRSECRRPIGTFE
jgi:hypothetical protein